MTAAAQKLEFSGISWAEIALNEHAMRLDFQWNGKILFVNRLFCEQTGIEEKAWLSKKNWRTHFRFLEGGREVDLSAMVRFGRAWRGLVSIVNNEGDVFLTHATAVPCMDLNENVRVVTLLISPTDMTRTSVSQDPANQTPENSSFQAVRESNGSSKRAGKPAGLELQPVEVLWPDQLFMFSETIQAGDDQFFTMVLQSAALIPKRFLISALVFKSLLPALLRTSVSATRYGIIHISIEPVETANNNLLLRLSIEDTGDRLGSGTVVRGGTVSAGRLNELKATADLFDICDTGLFYRSSAAGNQYEFSAEIQVLEPAKKGAASVHQIRSHPASAGNLKHEAGEFTTLALQELSFSELLSGREPADALIAADWIHSQRPTLFYLGNEEMAMRLHRFEKQLRNSPSDLWIEQFIQYRIELLDWIRNTLKNLTSKAHE